MNAQTLTTFFALLTVGSLFVVVAAAVGSVVLRTTGGPLWLAGIRNDVGSVAIRLAPLVAGTATLGSLWYSEYMEYVPCVLCWVQRIFMYSLAVVLTVGALRNDIGVRFYGMALAIPGAAVAGYHAWLQAYPRVTSFCTDDAPCAERVVWEFGFVSLPLGAFAGFMLVITLLAVATPPGLNASGAPSPHPGQADGSGSGNNDQVDMEVLP